MIEKKSKRSSNEGEGENGEGVRHREGQDYRHFFGDPSLVLEGQSMVGQGEAQTKRPELCPEVRGNASPNRGEPSFGP